MTLNLEGFKEVLNILKGLLGGVKTAIQLPENNRREMKEAIADTAELIDETLTILKQHITSILNELKFGDRQKARQLIYNLGSFQEWEQRYRQFQLCDSLREATFNLERKGLFRLLNKATFDDPDSVQQKMWDYIGGESNAANSVGTMLRELSALEGIVDTAPDKVILAIENARNEISEWRQTFIDFEKEIRNSM